MSQGEFTSVIREAGRPVTITRGADSITATMAGAIADPDHPLLKDARQDEILVRFTNDDFRGQVISKPERYDRITDQDGQVYAIQFALPNWGLAGELWGYTARIRGGK